MEKTTEEIWAHVPDVWYMTDCEGQWYKISGNDHQQFMHWISDPISDPTEYQDLTTYFKQFRVEHT